MKTTKNDVTKEIGDMEYYKFIVQRSTLKGGGGLNV